MKTSGVDVPRTRSVWPTRSGWSKRSELVVMKNAASSRSSVGKLKPSVVRSSKSDENSKRADEQWNGFDYRKRNLENSVKVTFQA